MRCHFSGTSLEAKKCQFLLTPEPLWAWLSSVLDPQDSIKELLNCVLWLFGNTKGGPMWTGASVSAHLLLFVIVNRRANPG